jgi:peroxiredoxin (alkyl hydroperoxide reductase subunit C)
MNLYIGKLASDFTAKAVMSDNVINENFNLKKYLKGHIGVVFFYPLDFTFVCPSEIIAFNNRISEFISRKAKIVAVSVDSHFSHYAWKSLPINNGGINSVQFPMVSDMKKEISNSYGVLSEEGFAYRATFVIDDQFVIRHYLVNDLPIGRNVNETIRIIDALEHHRVHGEVCPAGWNRGEKGIKPDSYSVTEYLISKADSL